MSSNDAPLCPPPDPNPHAPSFAVPAGATDCHAHVFGPASRYPYQDNRSYTPPDAPLSQLRAMHKALGIQRLVVVAASVHGTNNNPVLDAVAADPENLRGIATVGADIGDQELARLKDGGIRGIRVNLVDKGGNPFGSLDALGGIAERIRDLGFHIELLVHVESFPELRALAKRICVPLSVGHIGYTKAAAGGIAHPGYQEFLALLRDGYFWVKLTGPSRISAHRQRSLFRRRGHGQGRDRGGAGPCCVGIGLAARHAGEANAERRRSPGCARAMGARRSPSPAHSGRQPGAPVWICLNAFVAGAFK